ncbi:MAG: hypothetical protein KHW53_00610 [Veillonella sp.]|jgi:hypothetical protein|uniref:hypothetical protein n=1 Tax=Veillonella sp. TaxID=1926307 RepID=UPI00257D08AA|nr:hypothetical protein [Veillonella sp.]MBS5755197.1 hypothetical protein [Veillonella sp.]
MSRSNEYSYELEIERRRQIYLNRISATTEEYYHRYYKTYQDMKDNGLAAYIPSEMKRLESDLAELRNLLITDPEEARELSFEVGSYIRSMSSLALSARDQFERSERMRVENLRAEREYQHSILMDEYFQILKNITNPIVINYAKEGLQQLRGEIKKGNVTSITTLKEKSEYIISEAKSKAVEWKNHTINKNRLKNVAQSIGEIEERVNRENIEDQEKTKVFMSRIRKLRSDLEAGTLDANIVEAKVVEIESALDDTLITEETRRETVVAIVNQLKKQEFMVEKPQLVQVDGKNFVKIVAKQPSGKRAICNVDLQGKIAYKFDNYVGMTCLKEIEKFNVALDEIYSIKLSDERILWQNPDRLSMDANSLPYNEGRNA